MTVTIRKLFRISIGSIIGLGLMAFFVGVSSVLHILGRRGRRTRHRAIKPIDTMLITGRMNNKNWSRSHLAPLEAARTIRQLILLVDGALATGPKTRKVHVPRLLRWVQPKSIVRSLWVLWVAFKERPDFIMAYSFFPPGVFALLAARLTGAIAVVHLAGGPVELESGGLVTENELIPACLAKMIVPWCRRICGHFDVVIVRGQKALEYVEECVRPAVVRIIPGSVDPDRFQANGNVRTIDIVFVGRIVPFKQPEHIIEISKRVVRLRPRTRIVIAGHGPLLERLKQAAAAEGIADTCRFVGHVERVEQLLLRSRIFLLTSRSEGLSIALAESMIAGAVPVVADVGDLGELVVSGENGWLIQPGDFDAYAARIVELLEDESRWRIFSQRAHSAAMRNNSLANVVRHWEECFQTMECSQTSRG